MLISSKINSPIITAKNNKKKTLSKKLFLVLIPLFFKLFICNIANRIINIPKIHSYLRIYYEGSWFNKSVPVQLGLNFFYRSEYYGNAYEPSLQSYYVRQQ